MQKFNTRYANDAGFREFIEATNQDEVLYDFGYELYLRFGANTIEEAGLLVNPKILNIDTLIDYYESQEDFDRCGKLTEIKKRM